MYSNVFSFESVLFNSFSVSNLDVNISLHPEQIRVIEYRAISKGRKLLYEAIFPCSYIILFWWYVLNSYNSYLSGYTAGLIFFAAKSP